MFLLSYEKKTRFFWTHTTERTYEFYFTNDSQPEDEQIHDLNNKAERLHDEHGRVFIYKAFGECRAPAAVFEVYK